MKKFFKNIIVFFLLLPVVYVFGVIVWGEVSPQFLKKNLSYNVIGGNLNLRVKDIENYKNVDALVIGPSGAYRGFDPRIFAASNIKLFNLGSSSQTPLQTEILIDKYIQVLNPKIVLYVVTPDMFGEEGIESMVDLISCNQIDLDHVSVPLNTYNINVYNTLIFKTYKNIIGKGDDPALDITTNDDTYIKGGFVEKSQKVIDDKKYYPPVSLKVIKDQMTAFRQVLLKLKVQKVKVIFIQPPLAVNFYKSFKNTKIMNAFFENIDYKYMNFNLVSPYENKYFYDYGHLNQDGVAKFNKSVIDSLIKDHILF